MTDEPPTPTLIRVLRRHLEASLLPANEIDHRLRSALAGTLKDMLDELDFLDAIHRAET